MLTFVIPMISRQVCSDWERASQLLRGTLRSVLQQSDGDGVRAIVVGHERPELPRDGRLEFIPATFDPPAVPSEPTGIRDKFMKLSIGLQRAGELSTTYTMRLDADDRVHRDLAAFVNATPHVPGWNIIRAYNYVPHRPFVHLFDDWVEHAILNSSILQFPRAGHEPPDPSCLFSRWGHQELTAVLRCRGIELAPLPFAGACYVRHPGSLSSHRFANRGPRSLTPRLVLGRARRIRPLTRELRATFALER